ncbi:MULTISPECIES: RraA family protein [Pacificibacter]|uniref:RraA family protein n=1 Tax=Pacificibacter TaxID=1042323 RepID=UPI001C082E70|nr:MULTISPECIES: RraA family protein [Pacificibacter]MBU2936732.1 RraA family protein [Pacificibacter marinus]MDO6614466.1 RraA family protein [Pacificibacter sp. 1_MG-2023]
MLEQPAKLKIKRLNPRPSQAQIDAFQGVPTGFVADAMDGIGAMHHSIQALGVGEGLPFVAAGPALTAYNGPGDVLATLAALSFIQAGDVLVGSVDGFQGSASVGDRVIGMAKNCGAVAYVTDGTMRDFEGVAKIGLPCWCTGLNPNSPMITGPGTVGFGVHIGGRQVETGDMIVADRDGVVVVPFAEIDTVIARLVDITALETALDQKVEEGLKVPEDILEMLDSDQVKYVD